MDIKPVATMSDAELISELGSIVSMQGELKTQEAPLRAELLKRQKETGEQCVKADGWESRLKREPFSMAWFKRETGYTDADLPPECFTEEVKLVPDWERVDDWMKEQHGPDGGLPVTHSLTFQREKKAT